MKKSDAKRLRQGSGIYVWPWPHGSEREEGIVLNGPIPMDVNCSFCLDGQVLVFEVFTQHGPRVVSHRDLGKPLCPEEEKGLQAFVEKMFPITGMKFLKV